MASSPTPPEDNRALRDASLPAAVPEPQKSTVKKRLLIATDNFLPRLDGIARFLSEIIPRLRLLYDITVICPDFGPYEDSSITLIRVPVSKRIKIGDFPTPKFRYFKILRAVKQADIVFTQSIGPVGGLTLYLAHKNRKPVVSFIHSLETELVPRAVERPSLKRIFLQATKRAVSFLYARSTLLVVPSQGIAEYLAWQHITTHTHEVHLGVDPTKFCPAESRSDAKIALHLAPEDIVIGYHGRISYEKDLITLFRAFMRLQHKHPTVKLLVVGDGVDAIKTTLKSRAGVVMVGSRSDPEKYLQAMDIYVLPSLTETTSLSTLEAMSCGLPVVATEVGFVKDYIKPGFNGLFFPKGQAYFLARQLEKLVESVQLRTMLGSRARDTVVRDFNWDRTAHGIEHALEDAFALWKAKMKRHRPKELDDHFEKQARRHAEQNNDEVA